MDTVALIDGSTAHRATHDVVIAMTLMLHQIVPQAEVHHIGSTAFGGLTKGDIDFCLRVDAKDFPVVQAACDVAFQINDGSPRNTFFAAYTTTMSGIDVGIQLVVQSSAYDHFVRFKDMMQTSPALRAEYEALKRDAAPHGADHYRAAKAAFIERVLA